MRVTSEYVTRLQNGYTVKLTPSGVVLERIQMKGLVDDID